MATAAKLLSDGSYADLYREYYQLYPDCSYGSRFHQWARSIHLEPYNSFGNGSAMRVSPIGFAFETLADTLAEAEASAVVSHNHFEGIKGAKATAATVFMARTGGSKKQIKEYVGDTFAYDLNRNLADLQRNYEFNEICQTTVPESIYVFLQSTDYEDAIRKAISIGGDSDTIACIVGGIAEAFYKQIPSPILKEAKKRLDPDLWTVVADFYGRFNPSFKLP